MSRIDWAVVVAVSALIIAMGTLGVVFVHIVSVQ